MEDEKLENEMNETAEELSEQSEGLQDELGQYETELETKGKEAELTASKKIIQKLLKRKVILFGAIGIGILFMIILFSAILDSSGANDYVYKKTDCTNVTVHYDPYGPDEDSEETMPLEDYVRAAVNAYITDFVSDSSTNYHFYFALSVALRNEAITNNCEVTYRDKKLDTSSTTSDNYFLELALTDSYGITIVDKNESFVNAHVADNCWYDTKNTDDGEYHTVFQKDLEIPTDFTKKYFKNSVYEQCQCNHDSGEKKASKNENDICYIYWDEKVDTGTKINDTDSTKSDPLGSPGTTVRKKEYLHQDEEDGFNVYGAFYLLKYEGLTNLDILKYFFGENIYYRTTVKESKKNNKKDYISYNDSSCFWWPIGSDKLDVVDGITFASGTPHVTTITSYFGKRDAPTSTASTNHKAIDIAGGHEGDLNIIAVASGVVTKINTGCVSGDRSCGGRLGNYVKITHTDGTITRYGHMYSVSVSEGQTVYQGQFLGKMGTTGDSTGTHLDFQVIPPTSEPVDPLLYVSADNPRSSCSSYNIVGSTNQQTVCLNLFQRNNEYSVTALTGIMANIQAESGYDPLSLNKSSKAFGLAQWLGGRKENMKNACSSDLETNALIACQVDFIFTELNGSEANAKNHLVNNSSTASDAAQSFCLKYERPGESVCMTGKRQKIANSIYTYVENGCG